MNRYFSSDHHFFHKNILKYCERPFSLVEEMNEKLIENWNEVVKSNDEVYYLGDFGLCGPDILMPIRNRMNGNWKVFVAGNHDRTSLIRSDGLAETVINYTKIKSYKLWVDNMQVNLSHNPPVNAVNDGTIYLFGHTHTKLARERNLPVINIGVDAWNYYPVEWSRIMELI